MINRVMGQPTQSVGIFLSCVAALFSGTVLLHILVGGIVPLPYMDEIFHVDQMRRYCVGDFFDWNPKITTPPGLYITCLALLKPALFLLNPDVPSACYTPSVLRYFNAFFLTILFCIYFALFRLLSAGHKTSSVNISISALNLTLFPVCYFFSLLFYTDVLSTLSVLACYLLQQRRFHHWSALAGLCSCLIRQTNVVWVFFCAILTLVDLAVLHAEYFQAIKQNLTKKTVASSNNINLRRNLHIFGKSKFESDITNGPNANKAVNDQIIDFYDDPIALYLILRQIYAQKFHLFVNFTTTAFSRCFGYILVGFGFIFFVFWNGSIVLGDKSAHQSCLHVVQIFYCSAFILFFGFPMLSTYFFDVIQRVKTHGLFTRLLIVAILLCIYQFTTDHPYLLADNRHYTFYVWKNWFRFHPAMKYVLTPLYTFSFYVIIASLHRQSLIWRICFAACCLCVTVPNKLLEFRYFIVPYVFWRLHLNLQSKKVLLLEFLVYTAFNVLTLYVFLFKPFEWSTGWDKEAGSAQRFMW